MEISPAAYPAIGAVTAAIIAGSVSFISLMVAKDHKISEYRQDWINSLRKEISEYLALFVTITSYEKMAYDESLEKGKEYVKEQHDNWVKLNELDTTITLKLNPNEHDKLIDMINKATHLAADSKSVDIGNVDKLSTEITSESQLVLKQEWRRVKRGEWSYFITKWSALVLTVIGLIWLSSTYHIFYQAPTNSQNNDSPPKPYSLPKK